MKSKRFDQGYRTRLALGKEASPERRQRVKKKDLEQVIVAEKAAFANRKSRDVPRYQIFDMAREMVAKRMRRLFGDKGMDQAMKRLVA